MEFVLHREITAIPSDQVLFLPESILHVGWSQPVFVLPPGVWRDLGMPDHLKLNVEVV
jgi:hypothetical protein